MEKLLFIFTGGTIGSTVKGEYICTDENKPYVLIEGYKKKYGKIGEYDDLTPYTVLSENLNGEHLSKLIKTIGENIKKEYEGIIVTHGTDTLAYSAAALSYAFGKCEIPICIVSANYPLEDKRSNGYENLRGAVGFIKNIKKGGVWVSYQNQGDSVKIHCGSRLCPHICFTDRVESVKNSFYGFFDNEFEFIKNENYFEKNDEISPLFHNLSDISKRCKTVLRLESYPGMVFPEINENVKYILLGSFHSGTIDTLSDESKNFFKLAKEKNVKIFLTGLGNDIPYESTSVYNALGITPLPCISPVSAYVKLWLLEESGADVTKDVFYSLGGDIV